MDDLSAPGGLRQSAVAAAGAMLTVGPRTVTSSRAGAVVLGLALFCSPGLATEGADPRSAIMKLVQTGEVFCRPSLPYFCSNMHVSCSGRTTIATFAFRLRADRSQGTIESEAEPDGLRIEYENGRLEWDTKGTYVILFPRLASGYIKLLSDGTYTFRHYSQHVGVMSIGRCS